MERMSKEDRENMLALVSTKANMEQARMDLEDKITELDGKIEDVSAMIKDAGGTPEPAHAPLRVPGPAIAHGTVPEKK